MPVQTYTQNALPNATNPDTDGVRASRLAVTWAAMANGDTGSPFTSGGMRYLIFGVTGTFGVGGSISLEGSNNGGTTYTTLLDKSGAAVTLTAAGQKVIDCPYESVRPHVTAGDGTTALVPFVGAYK